MDWLLRLMPLGSWYLLGFLAITGGLVVAAFVWSMMREIRRTHEFSAADQLRSKKSRAYTRR